MSEPYRTHPTLHLTGAQCSTLFSAGLNYLLAPPPPPGYILAVLRFIAQWVPGKTGFRNTSSGGFAPTVGWGFLAAGNDACDTIDYFSINPHTNNGETIFRRGVSGSGTVGLYATSACVGMGLYLIKEFSGNDYTPTGPIVTAAIQAGGTAYNVGDTGTINTQAYTGGATYQVTSVNAGVVTGLTITAAGDGYHTAANPVSTTKGGAQPGGGSGLTVNITAIPPADGDFYFTLTTQLIPTF